MCCLSALHVWNMLDWKRVIWEYAVFRASFVMGIVLIEWATMSASDLNCFLGTFRPENGRSKENIRDRNGEY